jgi:uncharacterized membrane protein YgcG
MAVYKNVFLLFFLLFSFFAPHIAAQIKVPPAPQPARYMVDLANMLTPAEAQSIEDKLYGYFKAQQTQIVIVTVASLDGNTVEAYAEALFNTWGIGDKDRKDGLLLLISKNDRKMRIEVGYGLEATITDAFAAEVINVSLKTNFKNNEFYAGIDAATKKIIGKLTPNYNIPMTATDSIRRAQKKIDDERWADEQKQIEIARVLAAAKASDRNWLILKIIFYIICAIIVAFLIFRWLKQKEAMKLALQRDINRGEKRLAELDKLKQTAAYQENEHVSRFVDAYYDELNDLIKSSLHYQDTHKLTTLINAPQHDLIAYQHFAECYQKACVFTNFPPHKYYPAEARRFTEANKAQMKQISTLALITTDRSKNARTAIAANLPQVSLSTHFQNLFDALTATPNPCPNIAHSVLPIVQAFEQTTLFEQLIEAQPQSEVFLAPKASTIRNFAQKICDFCAQCHTAVALINKIATTEHTPQQLKNTYNDIVTTQASRVLAKFIISPPLDYKNLDYDLLDTYLQNRETDNLIAQLATQIYTPPLRLLLEKIRAFGTKENLTAKYKSTRTAVSIVALTNGISSDTATAQAKFDAGDHAAAFQTVVNMFNGIFSSSAYLNLYLVAIATRSYTTSSSSSSYSSSSYSDYTPPAYSDYKPPYSDYSDYKDYSDYSDSYSDSSYGGGSSGGGGASGDW